MFAVRMTTTVLFKLLKLSNVFVTLGVTNIVRNVCAHFFLHRFNTLKTAVLPRYDRDVNPQHNPLTEKEKNISGFGLK